MPFSLYSNSSLSSSLSWDEEEVSSGVSVLVGVPGVFGTDGVAVIPSTSLLPGAFWVFLALFSADFCSAAATSAFN